MALPVLKPAMTSDDALCTVIETIHRELIVAMFLTGSTKIADLQKVPLHITGKTRQMIGKENLVRIKR
jgi:isopentenyl-diphosphate delta-isomerase